MKLFLDDYRWPADVGLDEGWIIVRNIDAFREIVAEHLPEITHIALLEVGP